VNTDSTPPAEHALRRLRRPKRQKHLRRLPHCALLQRDVPKGALEGAPALLQGRRRRRASAPPPAPPVGPFVLPAGAPCGSCGGDVDITADGVKCGACFRVQYCNRACQKAHWPAHRAACGVALRARVRAGEGEVRGCSVHSNTLKPAIFLQ
jgi:hypothetical protein